MSKFSELLQKIIDKVNSAVKTVNGQSPDENGNVEVEGGGSAALSDEETLQLLMDMDIVQPLSDPNGVIYTDANDKLYVL